MADAEATPRQMEPAELEGLSAAELDAQGVVELPAREAMTIVFPGLSLRPLPLEGGETIEPVTSAEPVASPRPPMPA